MLFLNIRCKAVIVSGCSSPIAEMDYKMEPDEAISKWLWHLKMMHMVKSCSQPAELRCTFPDILFFILLLPSLILCTAG